MDDTQTWFYSRSSNEVNSGLPSKEKSPLPSGLAAAMHKLTSPKGTTSKLVMSFDGLDADCPCTNSVFTDATSQGSSSSHSETLNAERRRMHYQRKVFGNTILYIYIYKYMCSYLLCHEKMGDNHLQVAATRLHGKNRDSGKRSKEHLRIDWKGSGSGDSGSFSESDLTNFNFLQPECNACKCKYVE